MSSGKYSEGKIVVDAARKYRQDYFNGPEITAHLAGRVYVDH